jgi:ribosomal protein S12 methylthiotransferase accessory factor
MNARSSALAFLSQETPKGATGRRQATEATLARLLPVLIRYQITRVANITGLDRVGIPVYLAIRPNSRGLANSLGKGLEASDAKVSAIAESIESWHAEHYSGPARLSRFSELRAERRVADPARLPHCRDSEFSPDEVIPWVEAVDLFDGAPLWVPYEMVHADATVPRVPGSGCFAFSTNGLASGNSLAEAALHGLCELIERDAIAIWKQGSHYRGKKLRLDLTTVATPSCRSLLERLDAAELQAVSWDVTSDLGVPTIVTLIVDRTACADLAPYATAFGAGSHPDRSIALLRSLTEAAQSRLASISGSRDDLTREFYAAAQSRESLEWFAKIAREPGRRAFAAIPTREYATIEEDLRWVLERLRASGCDRAAMVDLSTEDSPLRVVRMVVPGLEGPSSSPSYVPGARALAAKT